MSYRNSSGDFLIILKIIMQYYSHLKNIPKVNSKKVTVFIFNFHKRIERS